jgi:hypothetical protein
VVQFPVPDLGQMRPCAIYVMIEAPYLGPECGTLPYTINSNLLYWYFQQNQCLNIKKNMLTQHTHVLRLACGSMIVGPRATTQRAHALRRHWGGGLRSRNSFQIIARNDEYFAHLLLNFVSHATSFMYFRHFYS